MFDSRLAQIRFGTGVSPHRPPPGAPEEMVFELDGPDRVAAAHPIAPFGAHHARFAGFREGRTVSRDASRPASVRKAAEDRADALLRGARQERLTNLGAVVARQIDAPLGLRERLTLFWTDHFAVRGRNPVARNLADSYVEAAIRPRAGGRFGDLLVAAALHPFMLTYLDAHRSVGPNSPFARSGAGRGLNENLAREVLELHTLGVDGPYAQGDVAELAALLTGFTADAGLVRRFRPRRAEPGAETVLGVPWGGDPARPSDAVDFLQVLALDPATARTICAKLAAHFVAESPDPAMVAAMTRAWAATQGRIADVVLAMMRHPAAWEGPGRVRRPVEMVAASLRALGVPGGAVAALEPRAIRRRIERPMRAMGQTWAIPPGPQGWPAEDAAWITAPSLGARLAWALRVPRATEADIPGGLPDPRAFAPFATGGRASPELTFAAAAAESRPEGVALVLTAPEFQRR